MDITYNAVEQSLRKVGQAHMRHIERGTARVFLAALNDRLQEHQRKGYTDTLRSDIEVTLKEMCITRHLTQTAYRALAHAFIAEQKRILRHRRPRTTLGRRQT